jgi:hypothetical protein
VLTDSFVITLTDPVGVLRNTTQTADVMLTTTLIMLYHYFKFCVTSDVFQRGHWYFGHCRLFEPRELTAPVTVTNPFNRLHQGKFWLSTSHLKKQTYPFSEKAWLLLPIDCKVCHNTSTPYWEILKVELAFLYFIKEIWTLLCWDFNLYFQTKLS